jgi:hypothetical protein
LCVCTIVGRGRYSYWYIYTYIHTCQYINIYIHKCVYINMCIYVLCINLSITTLIFFSITTYLLLNK